MDNLRERIRIDRLELLGRRREQGLYLVVGVWNTLFAYGVWALLQLQLHDDLPYPVILVLAWPFAVLNAYLCYRRFVFHSTGSMRREFPRFSLVYVATLIGALVALPFLLATLGLNIYVTQAGYTAAVVALSYLAHKFFSFGGQPGSTAGSAHREVEDVER